MLWVFDKLAAERRCLPLLADGVSSLCRQWVFGFGLWKAVVALILAILPIVFLLNGWAKHPKRWHADIQSQTSDRVRPAPASLQDRLQR